MQPQSALESALEYVDQQTTQLPKNQWLLLKNTKGCRISTVSGLLLVTVYNEITDIELRPGQHYLIPNNGPTLIEAIAHSRLLLERPLRKHAVVQHWLSWVRLALSARTRCH